MRISPISITKLRPNEVFVFGSNFSGIHGAGAALLAETRFGAKRGEGIGLFGQSYAIPTKDHLIRTLPIDDIADYVDEFIEFAKETPEYDFLVTEIGCGLAGYEPKDIAPLFKNAWNVSNIYLPIRFYSLINK